MAVMVAWLLERRGRQSAEILPGFFRAVYMRTRGEAQHPDKVATAGETASFLVPAITETLNTLDGWFCRVLPKHRTSG